MRPLILISGLPSFLPGMCKEDDRRRLIVNITDVGAQKAWSRYPSYTVSKAALESLTRVLAARLRRRSAVNAIAPGLVLRSDLVSEEEWQRLINRVRSNVRARRRNRLRPRIFSENEYITGKRLS